MIGMTWKELIRKRVMLLTLMMTVIFLAAFWFVAQAIGNRNSGAWTDTGSMEFILNQVMLGSMILTLGFFFGSFVIAFLSIFSSVAVVAGEAEQGVLQALLSRPLPRWKWFLGRWIGYVSMGVLYAGLLFACILGVAEYHAAVPGDAVTIMKGFALFALTVPLLVSLSMLGSCYFSAMGNGIVMTMLYSGGLLGGMIEKVVSMNMFRETNVKPLETVSGLLAIAMPADGLQRRMLAELFSLDDVNSFIDLQSTLSLFGGAALPSNSFLIYTVGYALMALLLGTWAFHRKDL
ncbi:ABC transporter permease subunit [Paenibacillus sp. y28]|uniref:ABC transporter permease subunit n=1 Tax=Paenibacillus sp. y28 TaxID=3129110 RepID=UPI00301A0275